MQDSETHSKEIIEEAEELINQFQTVQLATLNARGNPESSYAPYIRQSGRYYIFVSELASHTGNIVAHPTVSLFFIQNEESAKNLFARKRLTLECTAELIKRDQKQWGGLLDAFRDEHGPTIDLLRSLPDFLLFELRPVSGNFVKGFGQAYFLEGDDLQTARKAMSK